MRHLQLDRGLRIALYLLVASGALAVSWVEGRPVWLGLVLAAAICAHWTIDQGRLRPMHPNVGSVLALLLVIYFCYGALGAIQTGARKEAVLQLARLFCGVQVILFFSPFRPSMTWIFFGCNLLVLLLSGLLAPGPGMLPRMLVFFFCLSLVFALHGLLRSEGAVVAARQQQLGRHAGSPPTVHWLPGRLVLRGVLLCLAAACICTVCGLLLFFIWPRISTSTQPESLPGPLDSETSREGLAEALADLPGSVGFSPELSLQKLGPLRPDASEALLVKADGDLRRLASPDGYVYLRGLAHTVYSANRWQPVESRGLRLKAPDELFIEVSNGVSSVLASSAGRPQLALEIEPRTATGSVLFGSAPVRRVRPPERAADRIMIDSEGMLHAGVDLVPGDPLCTYALHCEVPVWADELGPEARALLPDGARRYIDWNSERAPQILELAADLTRGLNSDADKARAVRDYLRRSGRYRYTRFLNTLRHGEARIADFLFAADPDQRAGHCGYFATAMVLLARAAGLPARLALGYACPTPAGSRELLVLNAHAHAWAELYFADVGWVVYEATPAAGPDRAAPAPLTVSGEATLEREGPAQPDDAANPSDVGAVTTVDEERQGWEYLTGFDATVQRRLFARLGRRAAPWSFPALLLVLATALVWWLLRNRKTHAIPGTGRSRLPRRSQSVVRFYGRLLQVLADHGYRRASSETPRELAERVLREGGSAFEPVLLLTARFERVRYGEAGLNDAELAELKAALARVPPAPSG